MKIRSRATIVVSLVLFIFFSLVISPPADSIKIAVAATCPEKGAAISQQAGRTPFFLFFDNKGNFLEAVENPFSDQSRNAGPNAALFLADKGVMFVIAGDFGNKMKGALEEHQIQYVKKNRSCS